MLFTHDTELTLRAACGLINTDRMDVEQLGDHVVGASDVVSDADPVLGLAVAVDLQERLRG